MVSLANQFGIFLKNGCIIAVIKQKNCSLAGIRISETAFVRWLGFTRRPHKLWKTFKFYQLFNVILD